MLWILQILGIHGQDLLEKKKATEMIFFLAKFRMFLVRNTTTPDGEAIVEDSNTPYYRVEFDSDRLFSNLKVRKGKNDCDK